MSNPDTIEITKADAEALSWPGHWSQVHDAFDLTSYAYNDETFQVVAQTTDGRSVAIDCRKTPEAEAILSKIGFPSPRYPRALRYLSR